MALLRSAPLRGNLAMGWLPEPDGIRVAAEHDGVVPAPHHHGGGARSLGDGYQVARQYPLSPRRRELRCVPDGDNPAAGQDLAGVLLGAQHDAAVKPWDGQGTRRRSSHPSSMPRRAHGSQVFSVRALCELTPARGVADRREEEADAGLVEAGEGVPEVDGDAVGEACRDLQHPLLASGAGKA